MMSIFKKNKIFVLAAIALWLIASSDGKAGECGFNLKKISPSSAHPLIERLRDERFGHSRLRVIIETNKPGDIFGRIESIVPGNIFYFNNFCTTDVSVETIYRLVQLPIIKNIYIMGLASPKDTPCNVSNVIVGIIDRGIDWKSECFTDKTTGKSRILYYWDQTAWQSSGFFSGIPYGVEYTGNQLEQCKTTSDNSIPYDLGHGWLIAAVAAGNPQIKDIHGNQLLKVITIDSPVIPVNISARESSIFDAIAYITGKARQLNAKCVINLSYSKHFGPHTKDHLFTRAIDSLLDESSLLIVAAGNDGKKNIYAEKEFKRKTDMEFKTVKEIPFIDNHPEMFNVEIELWVDKEYEVEITLTSPTGNIYGPVPDGKYESYLKEGNIFIANAVSNEVGNQKGLFISLKAYKNQLPPDGIWNIGLKHSMNHSGGVVRTWITKSGICESNFKIQENEKYLKSVSALAFGKNIISVGSFEIVNNNELKEAPYSNFVQRKRDCNGTKPDMLTFGKVSLMVPEHHYPFIQDGTSVSCALITRLITCIWENKPGLKAQTLKKALQGKAMNLTEYEYRWVGMPQFHLEKAEPIISSLTNKIKEEENKNEI